jgi:hypothetical protein
MPQIELMQADLPHTLYNYKNNKPDDECERLNKEAMEKSRARREAAAASAKKQESGERQFTLDEVFSGAADEE